MPELPDVEVFRRYCQSTSLHQRITDVTVYSERILDGITEEGLRTYLRGQKFQGTDRHGKYLFLDVSGKGWLGLHFGMTGTLKYYKNDHEIPDYTRALYDFEEDSHLAFIMPRKLGSIFTVGQIQDFMEEKELGPDVFKEDFDEETFLELFSNRRGMSKSQLMNQKLISGIGNVYSDEILFQAKIHPRKKLKELSEEEKRRIFRAMEDVLDTAVEKQADPDQFPSSYLTPHRDNEATCPRCNREIEKIKVSGRSSYYCPFCQGE